MTNASTTQLKQALFDAYDGFADKRIKNLASGNRFIVDGRTRSDLASDGNVYGWFCSIFVEVLDGSKIEMTIVNIPTSDRVTDWLAKHSKANVRFGHRIEISAGEQDILLDLANHLTDITRPGRRYETAYYKHSVPRAAGALRRLHTVLAKVWAV